MSPTSCQTAPPRARLTPPPVCMAPRGETIAKIFKHCQPCTMHPHSNPTTCLAQIEAGNPGNHKSPNSRKTSRISVASSYDPYKRWGFPATVFWPTPIPSADLVHPPRRKRMSLQAPSSAASASAVPAASDHSPLSSFYASHAVAPATGRARRHRRPTVQHEMPALMQTPRKEVSFPVVLHPTDRGV
jgi:hypothetical protein